MKKNIFSQALKLLLVLSSLISCSSLNNKYTKKNISDNTSTMSTMSQILPNWIKNPKIKCSFRICGIGQGKTLEEAKQKAREEIAKVFSVKVKSKSSFSSQFHSSSLSSDISREVDKNITETTNQVLEGVEIVKIFASNHSFYVLMQLNKQIASKILKIAIKSNLNKIKIALKKNTRGSICRSYFKIDTVKELFKRWEIINQNPYAQNIVKKLEKIYNLKQKQKTMLFIKGKNMTINNLLSAQLSSFGYSILKDKNQKKAQVILSYQQKQTKQDIKIKGFLKYKVSLHLNFEFVSRYNKKSEKILDFNVVARSLQNVQTKIYESIKRKIKTEIFDLMID